MASLRDDSSPAGVVVAPRRADGRCFRVESRRARSRMAHGDGKSGVLPKIRIIYESGAPERTIEFEGSGPFHHDGEPGSILDVLLGHGVHLEHACGGKCACTTCHVIVKEGEQNLSPSTEKEEDELDTAPGLTLHSRLGCQAIVKGDITIVIPKYTINQVSGSH